MFQQQPFTSIFESLEKQTQTMLAMMTANNRHVQNVARRLATENRMLDMDLIVLVQRTTVSPPFSVKMAR